jgi:MFS family permease
VPTRKAVLLLLTAACPISSSVIIVVILPVRAEIFAGFGAQAFLTQLYFVAPALFAVVTSLALRRIVGQGAPETLLTAGVLGFAACGLADGLNTSHAPLAFAMRAGLGASTALLMTGFNRVAMQRWDRATSLWLLTYLNLATNAYGLATALLTAQLARWSGYAPFLLFGIPAIALAFYFALGSRARVPVGLQVEAAPTHRLETINTALPAVHAILIIVGHMAIHVLFYLHIARVEIVLGDYALGGGERTALYVFGHFLGALLFRPLNRMFNNVRMHLAAALSSSLVCTAMLAYVDGPSYVSAALLLPVGGLTLSHVLPLIFASIRDTVPQQEQGHRIADAVAAGFLGQFSAPFILLALQACFGPGVSPSLAAAIVSAALMPSAISLFLASRRSVNLI